MKVLVTGVNGFIGKNLKINFPDWMYFNEVLDSNTVIPSGYKFIVHLAYDFQSSNSIKNNTEAMLKVINYARENQARVVFPSTCAVYGHKYHRDLISEDEITGNNSLNDYGEMKLKCEKLILEAGIDYAILRLFNVYGPYQKNNYLLPEIINNIKLNKNIYIKNPENVLDFIFVADVCEIIKKIVESKEKRLILNVGSGTAYSVKEVVSILSGLTDYDINKVTWNEDTKAEPIKLVANNSRLKSLLNLNFTCLKNGLKKTLES